MSLGLMATQALAKAAPKDAVVHKWHVFQHIREAHGRLGASDRALAILNALLWGSVGISAIIPAKGKRSCLD